MWSAVRRADRPNLVSHDPPGSSSPNSNGVTVAAAVQLGQAVGDAVHLAAEGLPQPPGVAIVVAIGQHDVPRGRRRAR